MKRVLLVDSKSHDSRSLRDSLTADGHEVIECATEAESVAAFGAGVDGAILYSPPEGATNLDLLRALRAIQSEAPVIMVSASSAETLEALREGAYYVTRPPLTADEVSILIRRALAEHARPEARREDSPPVLIGNDPAIEAIREAVGRLASKPATVLITGESGTGKAAVGRLLHWTTQQGGPLLRCSLADSSVDSLEVDLFGSEQDGAEQPGLVERADGGTLCLGDISQVPLPVQLKLLRFVEERSFRRVGSKVDRCSQVRLVVTSTRHLDAIVAQGLLRPELAYRLAAVILELPPLRERKPDIRLLAEYFLNSGSPTPSRRLSQSVLDRLTEYSWPGNVRELSNLIETARVRSDAECLELDHFPVLPTPRPAVVNYLLPSQGISFRELERELLSQALRLASGNQTRAASLLGLTRDQIRYRMAKFGMSSRDGARVRAA